MHRKRNRAISWISAILMALVLLLSACSPGIEETGGTSASSLGTAVPGSRGLGDVLPQEYIVRLPVDPFRCYPDAAYLGGGRVFIIEKTREYQFEDEENSGGINDEPAGTMIYDIVGNTITRGPDVTNTTDIVMTGDDGKSVLTYDYLTGEYRIFDPALNVTDSFKTDVPGVTFGGDLSTYYYVDSGYIVKRDRASGTSGFVDVPYGYAVNYIESVDTDRNIMYAIVPTSRYDYGAARMGLDMNTWEIKEFTPIVMESTHYDGREYFRDIDNSSIVCQDGETTYSLTLAGGGEYTGSAILAGSPYCSVFQFNGSDGSATGKRANSVIRMGTDMKTCDFTEYCDDAVYFLAYMAGDDMILSLVEDDPAGDGRHYSLAVLRTDIMPFESMSGVRVGTRETLRQDLIDRYTEEGTVARVGDHLTDVRARADGIGERYGIGIFMSNQCAVPLQGSKYILSYTDSFDPAAEAATVSKALDYIEATLAKYPEGFFAQFRDIRGNGGICLYLIGSITSEYGVIGFHSHERNRYDVALDVNHLYSFESTLSHELWHATEEKIYQADFAWDEGWDSLNPVGFSYLEDYGASDPDPNKWTYMGEPSGDVYFVDTYSKTFAKEDRARIMEYVMYDRGYSEEMFRSSHLRAKLGMMCDAVRRVFDTAGWDELYWERFF